MRRPVALLLALVLGLVAGSAAEAQGPGKVWRIAVLTGALARSSAPVRALEQRLARGGYGGRTRQAATWRSGPAHATLPAAGAATAAPAPVEHRASRAAAALS